MLLLERLLLQKMAVAVVYVSHHASSQCQSLATKHALLSQKQFWPMPAVQAIGHTEVLEHCITGSCSR